MMLYVNEGLKNTICRPTFTDVRDGIIQAAMDNHGGEDVCRMWTAFAAFGLGIERGERRAQQHDAHQRLQRARVLPGRRRDHRLHRRLRDEPGLDGEPARHRHRDHRARGQRGNPDTTTSSGTKQQGTTPSGVNALVTGPLAGASAGVNDIDGGVTTVQSPADHPAQRHPDPELQLLPGPRHQRRRPPTSSGPSWSNAAGTATQVFQELGAADDDDAAYVTQTVNISQFAGQTVRIRFQAADAATASLVEAAVDDVRITSP